MRKTPSPFPSSVNAGIPSKYILKNAQKHKSVLLLNCVSVFPLLGSGGLSRHVYNSKRKSQRRQTGIKIVVSGK